MATESAGSCFSTAAATKFATAVARGLFGEALSDDPESLVALTTPAPGGSYGLGILLQEAHMGHAGMIAGFRSVLNHDSEFDTVVLMVYNHDSADPEQRLADVVNPVLPRLHVAE